MLALYKGIWPRFTGGFPFHLPSDWCTVLVNEACSTVRLVFLTGPLDGVTDLAKVVEELACRVGRAPREHKFLYAHGDVAGIADPDAPVGNFSRELQPQHGAINSHLKPKHYIFFSAEGDCL